MKKLQYGENCKVAYQQDIAIWRRKTAWGLVAGTLRPPFSHPRAAIRTAAGRPPAARAGRSLCWFHCGRCCCFGHSLWQAIAGLRLAGKWDRHAALPSRSCIHSCKGAERLGVLPQALHTGARRFGCRATAAALHGQTGRARDVPPLSDSDGEALPSRCLGRKSCAWRSPRRDLDSVSLKAQGALRLAEGGVALTP